LDGIEKNTSDSAAARPWLTPFLVKCYAHKNTRPQAASPLASGGSALVN